MARRGEKILAATRLFNALDWVTPVEELPHTRAFLDKESQEEEPLLLREIKRLEKELELVQERLLKLQESRQRLLRGLHACESLLLTSLDSDQRKWLELRKTQLALKLREKSQLKISLLEAEMLGLEERVQRLKTIRLSMVSAPSIAEN